jgi:hypothetical protein
VIDFTSLVIDLHFLLSSRLLILQSFTPTTFSILDFRSKKRQRRHSK